MPNRDAWKYSVDESSNAGGSGARVLLTDPEGQDYPYALHFDFRTKNNEAEYEALITSLKLASQGFEHSRPRHLQRLANCGPNSQGGLRGYGVQLANELGRGRDAATHIFFQLLLDNNLDMTEVILMLCDAIWSQRNSDIIEHKYIDEGIFTGSVLNTLKSFHQANSWSQCVSDALTMISLVEPPLQTMRIYFDSRITTGVAGLGFVAVDEHGAFLKGAGKRIFHVLDPLNAEALAMKEAIFLRELLSKPRIEGGMHCA